jgi:hypothetical protein
VDGALMRFVITGPLHWLGILDLASPAEDVPPSAFAYSSWSGELLKGMAPIGLPEENGIIVARSDARLWVPRLAGRSVRYQVARFCDWEEEKEEGYLYKISPASLERARLSGLRVGGLLSILRRYATSVPPVLARALERWDERGVEAKIQGLVVLRLGSPEILQALRNSRAARFLGDPLGPTAVIIKDNAWNKVVAVLAELGYLSEVQLEEPVKGAPE